MDHAAPRCYVLNELFKLVLASAPSPDDPLYPFYDATSSPDALPQEIECTVRTLTDRWERLGQPVEGSALIRGLRITVVPLHGAGGRHIAVFIESDSTQESDWEYAATA